MFRRIIVVLSLVVIWLGSTRTPAYADVCPDRTLYCYASCPSDLRTICHVMGCIDKTESCTADDSGRCEIFPQYMIACTYEHPYGPASSQ